MTPFMILWVSNTIITSYLRGNSKVQAVEHHIEHQKQVLQLLKDNLVLAQNRMKQEVDQHHSERSFEVASRLHPVFHVSCLKRVIGDKLPVQTVLLEIDEEGKFILEPEAVTEIRTRQLRNRSISEYLIKWKNLSTKDSTWEDDNFIQKNPNLLKH
eukprot:PITA_18229